MTTEDKTTDTKTSPLLNHEVDNVGPREKMISTAVHFLTNPKVSREGSVHQKKAFLQSKGLTEEEINLAFARANIKNTSTVNSTFLPVAERPAVLQPPPSLWMRINHIGSSVIIIAIACYGIHRIYKLYIEPWLFGEQLKEDRLTKMEHQLVELNSSLSQLRRSLGNIQHSLATQRTQQSEEVIPSSDLRQNPLLFNDIKTDIATIKSLLLGRQRFPPAPNVSPTIPSWQLEISSSEKKNEEENSAEKKPVLDTKEGEENPTEQSISISKGLEVNSLCEELSKSPDHMILNSSANEVPEDTATNEISTGFEGSLSLVSIESSESSVNELMSFSTNGKFRQSSTNEISDGSEVNLVSEGYSQSSIQDETVASPINGESKYTVAGESDADES